MLSGLVRNIAISAAAVVAAVTVVSLQPANADPDQDQKFFDLLGQKEIPPVDNANSLITSARHACQKLDGGMSVNDLVELVRNNGFSDNPLARLAPQDRITRTIDQFINAAVEAYCPYDKGKIASIAAYNSAPARIELTSLTQPIHTGEINPTKPLPVPVQQAPVPDEIQPVPQEPPPPPRRLAPPPPKQPPPPAQEPPPPAQGPREGPPEVGPPAPSAPGSGTGGNGPGGPGGDAGGGSAPAPETPDQPSPPGHIRLAP